MATLSATHFSSRTGGGGRLRDAQSPLALCRAAGFRAVLLCWAVFFWGAALPGEPEKAGAAVVMDSGGQVTSIGVPPSGPPPATDGDSRMETPPRPGSGEATAYPDLPWGIVPEIHVPWPAPHYGNRPGGGPSNRPDNWQGNWQGDRPGNRPGNWQGNRPDNRPGNRPGNWQGNRPDNRPGGWQGNKPSGPSSGWNPSPGGQPQSPSWGGNQGNRPGPGKPGTSGSGTSGPGAGRPGSGPAPQLVRPPLGSVHLPGGGSGGSSVLMPPGR